MVMKSLQLITALALMLAGGLLIMNKPTLIPIAGISLLIAGVITATQTIAKK